MTHLSMPSPTHHLLIVKKKHKNHYTSPEAQTKGKNKDKKREIERKKKDDGKKTTKTMNEGIE